MECISDATCPELYSCQLAICTHEPLTTFSPQIVVSVFVLPFLIALSNKVGSSAVWLVYPILISIMAYQMNESMNMIAPIVMAASFISLYLSLKQKKQVSQTPAINFYIVNITIPVLIVGTNIGLILTELVPFLYICIIAIILSCAFITFAYWQLKSTTTNEKIQDGIFKKMLPPRLKNPKKPNLTIQMTMIQQADSQYEQNTNQLSPTKKTKIRQQILSNIQNSFPIKQFVISLLSFLTFQCMAISLPSIIQLLGAQTTNSQLLITYAILIVLVILGQLYLYQFYIYPTIIKQQFIKSSLGLQLDWIKMIKICIIGLIGGILEGLIGFGFYFSLLLYLVHSRITLKDAIATCGFMNVFIGAIFSLKSIFCGQFHILVYLIIFLITLLTSIGTQFLFESYIQNNIKMSSINSTLVALIIIIAVLCLLFISLSFGLNWNRFGFNSITQIGNIPSC